MSFQEIILVISTVMLCLMLLMIGVLMYNRKYKDIYPPVQSTCPDYWKFVKKINSLTNKEEMQCENVQNLGTCSNENVKNFNGGEWNGTNGMCNKQKWARRCDLSWDGITNNTRVCKNDSTLYSSKGNESIFSKFFKEFDSGV